jgi:hypothetical protein
MEALILHTFIPLSPRSHCLTRPSCFLLHSELRRRSNCVEYITAAAIVWAEYLRSLFVIPARHLDGCWRVRLCTWEIKMTRRAVWLLACFEHEYFMFEGFPDAFSGGRQCNGRLGHRRE